LNVLAIPIVICSTISAFHPEPNADDSIQRPFEPIAFGIGWLALMVSVLPPIDAWAVVRFSAHVFQHELMMLVGAPLVTAGRPIPVWLAALPRSTAARGVAILQSGATRRAWKGVTMPIVAWTLHGGAIWLWHLPALYDAAVGNEAIHLLEHMMFVGTAVVFWYGCCTDGTAASGTAPRCSTCSPRAGIDLG
jgi:cytochrome c oxidase assembly factor CtaG